MNIKKYFFSLFILTAFFVLAGCGTKNESASPAVDESPIIFFYGDLCPHCKTVEKYFEENKVAEKIQFSQREIYRDKANSALLSEKAKECGLDEKTLGVPFLWAEGKCLMGDEDVIKYFEEKINPIE